MKVAISFVHPDGVLAPNASFPLQPRAAAAKNALRMRRKAEVRADARVRAEEVLQVMGVERFVPCCVDVRWFYRGVCPDVDNVVARLKPLLDGCADAFGVDDRCLELGRVQRVHALGELGCEVELVFSDELDFSLN